LRDIQVEEVAVEDGLHTTRHNSDQVEESGVVVSVDPVEDVEGTVRSQCEQVVRGDGLRFTRLRDHEELWKDGDRLEVDGEGPQHLHHRHAVVHQHRQTGNRNDDELDAECVVVGIVGASKLEEDEVTGGKGCNNEDAFHHRVVHRDERGGQVQVPGQEHQCEQGLGFTGHAGT